MNTPYFVHETAVVDQPVRIGKGTKIWHFSHIMAKCEIGENCSFGQNVFVAEGVKVGHNVRVQNNVSLYKGVICEDDVFIGPSAVFTNVKNPRSAVPRKNQFQETYIEKGASVGANATIICGVRLGKFCFIGAGAVVTKDVLPYALITGNPGTQTGWMSEYGHLLNFDAAGYARCSESDQAYILKDGMISRKT